MEIYTEADVGNFFECVNRMADLYVSYRKRYVIMDKGSIFIPKVKTDGKVSTLPLSNRTICGHLNKNFSICVFAGEKSSKFICFDVDDGGIPVVKKILEAIEEIGIGNEYVHVSYSGGKGYHVEIFFDGLVYTDCLKSFYDMVCIKASLDVKKVEFRPTFKQSIKLPLSVHYKTGNECLFLNKETWTPMYGMEYLLTIKQFSSAEFNEIAYALPLKGTIPNFEEVQSMECKLLTSDGVCRLEGNGYPMLTRVGECNSTMLAIAVHNRYRGLEREEAEKELTRWFESQDQSFITDPLNEMYSKIAGMVKWVYDDRFKLKNDKPVFVTKRDMDYCLKAAEKSERKILFLTLLFQKKYTRLKMSYEKIAEYIGNPRITVARAVERLQKNGVIYVSKGKTALTDGGYKAESNNYRLNGYAQSDEGAIFKVEKITPENFLSIYHQCVVLSVGESDAKKHFTKKEMQKINEL